MPLRLRPVLQTCPLQAERLASDMDIEQVSEKRIKAPKAAKLRGAFCNSVSEPHDLYTTLPIESPAPCLVSCVRDGIQDWRGMIVALPEDAPSEPCQIREIEVGLGIIQTCAAGNIVAASRSGIASSLHALSHCDVPFVPFSAKELEMALELIKTELVSHGCLSKTARAKFDAVAQHRIRQFNVNRGWSPMVICERIDLSRHRDNWDILRNWRIWLGDLRELIAYRERSWKMPPSLRRYCMESGKSVDIAFSDYVRRDALDVLEWKFQMMMNSRGTRARNYSNPEWHMNHLKSKKAELSAFRHRLGYLGLPANKTSLNNAIATIDGSGS